MNWFQNCIFMWWITANGREIIYKNLLWIDFKIVFLCDESQLLYRNLASSLSCELISKLYFYVMNHSTLETLPIQYLVVNWFQNCIFMWWITARTSNLYFQLLLWIDFKIVFLCDESQPSRLKGTLEARCELISKLYFYVMNHSYLYTTN